MMNRLRRFYNQNRKGVWLIIIMIILLYILLQIIDFFVAEKNKKENEEKNNNQVIQNEIKTDNNIKLESNKSSITGEKKQTSMLNTEVEAIQKFLNLCTQGKVEEAYEMLTQECKEEMYSSLEEFTNLYYNNSFAQENMSFDIENWVDSTYKVKIYGDILATGKEAAEDALQDYITVKNVDNEYKLNINSYIGRYEINKDSEKDNVKITVVSRDVYMDYETYDIKVENNSDKDILLDTKQNVKSMYVIDSKKAKYSSYNNEITIADLTVRSGQTKNLKIKYYNSYNISKEIEKLVFSDVVMDYDISTQAIKRDSIQQIEVLI